MQVEISGISKKFGKETVLCDVSLSIEKGEILCLLGPSGAGKTTLIRLIIGAISPNGGQIHINDTLVPDMNIIRNTGFMPQNDALYSDLTGKENLKFFGRLYKMKGKNLSFRVDEMLKFVDLYNDRDKLVQNFSGGMKKRLSLAIALLHDPDILVLDEPTVGIDPVLRKKIWDEFSALADAGKTLIVSTHVMDEASRCKKAALLYNGKLIAFDSVENIVSKTKSGLIEEIFFSAESSGEVI